jgi:plastocyanin
MRMKKLAFVLSLLALGAFGFAACGSDDEDETTAATTETTVEADGEAVQLEADPDGALAYVQDSLSAPAGAVTIEFDNPSATGHDVVVEDADGQEITATEVISEDSATAVGEFEAGDYAYFCSVSGHREAGMEGTLTVK